MPATILPARDSRRQEPRTPAGPSQRGVPYADDLARWPSGAYGNREVRTPHIDRLAREGALLTHAFTCTPVCSPSRAGMFASRFPTQLGIDDWIDPESEPDLGLAPKRDHLAQTAPGRGVCHGPLRQMAPGDPFRVPPVEEWLAAISSSLGGGTRR
ncbi:MAG: sulfatase-like hydrolase/transferase [Isosphaeraceae bacterium]